MGLGCPPVNGPMGKQTGHSGWSERWRGPEGAKPISQRRKRGGAAVSWFCGLHWVSIAVDRKEEAGEWQARFRKAASVTVRSRTALLHAWAASGCHC